MGRRS